MLKNRQIFILFKRFKHSKTHWSIVQKQKHTKDKALEHFDDFYGSVYGNRWKSIRIGLLCDHKYIAMVNNFGNTEETISELELAGAINIRSIYNVTTNLIKSNRATKQSDPKQNTQIDQNVERFMKKQQFDEISTLYGEELAESKAAADRDTNHAKDQSKSSTPVDYKKSLEKSIEEDTEIDHSRLIDASIGSAGLYEYVPASKLKGMDDWVLESDHYKYYSTTTDFPLTFEMEPSLKIPENLQLYTYEKGNISEFMNIKPSLTGVSTHFLMNGASILPVLALGVEPGDVVLDACAAPGGKSLLMLQTLHPKMLVCNDVMESRLNRIRKLFHEYFYDYNELWNNKRCILSQQDARVLNEYGMYDKILVDVPCTNDRHSVMENDNNIFKSARVKERLRIPELQAAILTNCIQLLKPGGSLVYSTCSLSPVQNDGVVHMALSNVFSEYSITATIKDLREVIKPLSNIFKFENPKNLKYGQQVLPFLTANFGPMYFCKITRNN